MTTWKAIHDQYWGGMKNPDLVAYETYFGWVRLLVIHDAGGWACKCLIFGEVRFPYSRNAEDAKAHAVQHLSSVLMKAIDAMEAAGEPSVGVTL